MQLNEYLGRILACIIFLSGMVFCATLPDAHAQAREFWWCVISGTTLLIAGILLGLLIKQDHHF
jgi:hypothetical protein